MNRIYIPAKDLDDWRRLLADPEAKWRDDRSAELLARAWMEADGFPLAVKRALHNSGHELFRDMRILLAIPQYMVPPPGDSAATKSDLFVLAESTGQLTAFMIEARGSESFGPTVSEWLQQDATEAEKSQLEYLNSTVGLQEQQISDIRYRLLQSTASALIEAGRYRANNAVMLVHSFSENYLGSDDFVAFAKCYGLTPEPNRLHFIGYVNKIRLFLGWIADF